MDAIHAALDSGTDPRLLARQVVDYLRALLLVQMGNGSQVDLATDTLAQAARHAKAFSTPDVLRMIKAFNVAATDLRGGWQPSLPLELALAEVMEAPQILFQMAAPGEVVKAPVKEKVEKPAAKAAVQKEVDKPAVASAPKPESSITLEQVGKAWKQIKEVLHENKALNPLLNSSRPMEVKGGVLVLGCSTDFVREKMELPENKEIILRAIAEVTGKDLKLRCVVTNAKQSVPPDVKADGMVAAALKKGGEIVDIQ
jgi:DNA polymerase-3 subunit gamma/tau